MKLFGHPSKFDWPKEISQDYTAQCGNCGTYYSAPKRSPSCWGCLSDAQRDHYLAVLEDKDNG